MNTMQVTKFVAAICGSLLVFLLIGLVAHALYSTESEAVGYSIPVEGAEEGGEEPAEAVDMAALMEAADPAAGEGVFRRCAACHSVAPGENGVGPTLAGVVGRDVASLPDFTYSEALAAVEGNWDYEQLGAFLTNPRGYVPGTAMQFAGLANPEERANLIAWLEAQ